MMEELKPCPFCGNDQITEAALSRGDWYICEICDAESGNGGKETWNTRPIEEALTATIAQKDAEIERLRGTLRKIRDTDFSEEAGTDLEDGFLTLEEIMDLIIESAREALEVNND